MKVQDEKVEDLVYKDDNESTLQHSESLVGEEQSSISPRDHHLDEPYELKSPTTLVQVELSSLKQDFK